MQNPFLARAAAVLLAAALPALAAAQGYPSKPIKIIMPIAGYVRL